ncbi:hypothetical protein FRB90_005169 [Tulasnella sp. 427]|nr:hypothetical protein FRB90_005169 [Tulasnella sp. 427]
MSSDDSLPSKNTSQRGPPSFQPSQSLSLGSTPSQLHSGRRYVPDMAFLEYREDGHTMSSPERPDDIELTTTHSPSPETFPGHEVGNEREFQAHQHPQDYLSQRSNIHDAFESADAQDEAPGVDDPTNVESAAQGCSFSNDETTAHAHENRPAGNVLIVDDDEIEYEDPAETEARNRLAAQFTISSDLDIEDPATNEGSTPHSHPEDLNLPADHLVSQILRSSSSAWPQATVSDDSSTMNMGPHERDDIQTQTSPRASFPAAHCPPSNGLIAVATGKPMLERIAEEGVDQTAPMSDGMDQGPSRVDTAFRDGEFHPRDFAAPSEGGINLAGDSKPGYREAVYWLVYAATWSARNEGRDWDGQIPIHPPQLPQSPLQQEHQQPVDGELSSPLEEGERNASRSLTREARQDARTEDDRTAPANLSGSDANEVGTVDLTEHGNIIDESDDESVNNSIFFNTLPAPVTSPREGREAASRGSASLRVSRDVGGILMLRMRIGLSLWVRAMTDALSKLYRRMNGKRS